MNISDKPRDVSAAALARPANVKQRADSPEEAAQQFEEVLVRQFVQTMTDGLFEQSLAGEGAVGGGAYADLQRDALTDTLTDHLVDSGALRLSDLLLRQWGGSGSGDAETADPPAPARRSGDAERGLDVDPSSNS